MTAPPVQLQLIKPVGSVDPRGWFSDASDYVTFKTIGIDGEFVENTHSMSERAYTVRGLHFQTRPRDREKLIQCTRGRVFDVAVDVRAGSSIFGEWVWTEVSASNSFQLLVQAAYGRAILAAGEE